jgi:hypothetical protein
MTKEIFNKIYRFITKQGFYLRDFGLNDYLLSLQDTKILLQLIFENNIKILGFEAWEINEGKYKMKGEYGWASKNDSDFNQAYTEAIETLAYFLDDNYFMFTVQYEGENAFLVNQGGLSPNTLCQPGSVDS